MSALGRMRHPVSTPRRRANPSAGRSGQMQASAGRRATLAGILAVALSAVSGTGCGGGSPSDIVPPGAVDVVLTPLTEVLPGSVSLELAGASGRDLSIRVEAVQLDSVAGVAFELRYDPALLDFTGIAPGVFLGAEAVLGANVVEAAPGVLVGVATLPDPSVLRSGSGALLTLLFRLEQLRDAETTLVFGVPQSTVYARGGPAEGDGFTGARLVTLIRPPS